MHKIKSLTIILICGGLLLSFLSCQTPAGRSMGQVVDDATITTKVKGKIFGDSIFEGFSISVETFQGEVTLTGAVDTQYAKKRAGDLARSTLGVRKINNFIKIK